MSGHPGAIYKGITDLDEAPMEWNMALGNGTWGPPELQPHPPQPANLVMIDFASEFTCHDMCYSFGLTCFDVPFIFDRLGASTCSSTNPMLSTIVPNQAHRLSICIFTAATNNAKASCLCAECADDSNSEDIHPSKWINKLCQACSSNQLYQACSSNCINQSCNSNISYAVGS